jgi:hypothetical protein
MHEDTYDIYLLQQRSSNPKHFFQFEEAKEIHQVFAALAAAPVLRLALYICTFVPSTFVDQSALYLTVNSR